LVRKNGRRRGVQRFRCLACGKQFQSKRRDKLTPKIWSDYVFGKQSFRELEAKYGESIPTLKKRFETIKFNQPVLKPKQVVLGVDTVFYGHEFGVTVFRGLMSKKNLLWYFSETENLDLIVTGINELINQKLTILMIVCDGKNLHLSSYFPNIPLQMCQFHQIAIIKRYLTINPKLLASQQLKQIAELLPKTTEAKFTILLDAWYFRWSGFLKEKTIVSGTKRWFYTHKRTRSAYRSLVTNLSYLFTYQKLSKQYRLKLPNTNNSLEGSFAHLKDKVRLHRGLKLNRKLKLINQILAGKTSQNFH